MVGDRWTAIDSVACYVPRGKLDTVPTTRTEVP
nr:hypothetical protein [Phyllobacterium salinisoli]